MDIDSFISKNGYLLDSEYEDGDERTRDIRKAVGEGCWASELVEKGFSPSDVTNEIPFYVRVKWLREPLAQRGLEPIGTVGSDLSSEQVELAIYIYECFFSSMGNCMIVDHYYGEGMDAYVVENTWPALQVIGNEKLNEMLQLVFMDVGVWDEFKTGDGEAVGAAMEKCVNTSVLDQLFCGRSDYEKDVEYSLGYILSAIPFDPSEDTLDVENFKPCIHEMYLRKYIYENLDRIWLDPKYIK